VYFGDQQDKGSERY